jgi:ABC-type lipopolysaccharide export system ATPase subunit
LETFVVLGVYDQLGLKFDAVAESQTVMEFVVDQIQAGVANSMTETPSEARNLLQQFEFPKTRWDERISILSGGERRRLQLLSVLSVVSGLIRVIEEYAIRKISIECAHIIFLSAPYSSFTETKLFSPRRT